MKACPPATLLCSGLHYKFQIYYIKTKSSCQPSTGFYETVSKTRKTITFRRRDCFRRLNMLQSPAEPAAAKTLVASSFRAGYDKAVKVAPCFFGEPEREGNPLIAANSTGKATSSFRFFYGVP
jgi:hypothetical protein